MTVKQHDMAPPGKKMFPKPSSNHPSTHQPTCRKEQATHRIGGAHGAKGTICPFFATWEVYKSTYGMAENFESSAVRAERLVCVQYQVVRKFHPSPSAEIINPPDTGDWRQVFPPAGYPPNGKKRARSVVWLVGVTHRRKLWFSLALSLSCFPFSGAESGPRSLYARSVRLDSRTCV